MCIGTTRFVRLGSPCLITCWIMYNMYIWGEVFVANGVVLTCIIAIDTTPKESFHIPTNTPQQFVQLLRTFHLLRELAVCTLLKRRNVHVQRRLVVLHALLRHRLPDLHRLLRRRLLQLVAILPQKTFLRARRPTRLPDSSPRRSALWIVRPVATRDDNEEPNGREYGRSPPQTCPRRDSDSAPPTCWARRARAALPTAPDCPRR